MGAHRMWWVGDWWNYGEAVFGETCFQEAEDELERETGFAFNTVRLAAWVASKFPPCDRVPDVSFRHHQKVASVDDRDMRRRLLEDARDQDWTLARLRREVDRCRLIDNNSAFRRMSKPSVHTSPGCIGAGPDGSMPT